MAKKISNDDLTWLVTQEFNESATGPWSIGVAIVADDIHGWRAIIARRSRRNIGNKRRRELANIEERLRLECKLVE